MITYKFIGGSYRYVFSKDQINFALTPVQLLEMHVLLDGLVPEAIEKIAEKAAADSKLLKWQADRILELQSELKNAAEDWAK